MAIPFNEYVRCRNKYCLSYLGTDPNVVKFLLEARPIIEDKFSSISLYLFLKDEMKPVDLVNVILESETVLYQKKMSYIREVESISDIKSFLSESGIEIFGSPA
jgi:hypothetical protein